MNPSPYPAPATTFTSAHVRARIVKILLIVGAVLSVISFFAESLSLAFPPLGDEQELGDNPIGAAIMLLIFLLAVLEILIYLVTAIFFCVWLYRAAANLVAFNPWNRSEYSPGWAVGSFFVPFVNLVVPYRAVREVWQKSGTPDELLHAEPGPPATFPLWWMFWLLASVGGRIAMRVSFDDNVPMRTATMVSLGVKPLFIAASIFAYLVVDAIDKKQEETSRKIKLGKFAEPPLPVMSDFVAPVSSGPTHYQQS